MAGFVRLPVEATRMGSGRDELPMELRQRFDVDAAPATQREMLRDRVDDGVIRADVDEEACRLRSEEAPQHHVLTELREGHHLSPIVNHRLRF